MKVLKKLIASPILLFPSVAFAQWFGKIEPLPSSMKLGDILTKVIGWILWLAGALVVIYLIYGGIVYVTAAGNEDKVKAGKSILLNAIIGIIIILVSYALVTWVRGILAKGQAGY